MSGSESRGDHTSPKGCTLSSSTRNSDSSSSGILPASNSVTAWSFRVPRLPIIRNAVRLESNRNPIRPRFAAGASSALLSGAGGCGAVAAASEGGMDGAGGEELK